MSYSHAFQFLHMLSYQYFLLHYYNQGIFQNTGVVIQHKGQLEPP